MITKLKYFFATILCLALGTSLFQACGVYSSSGVSISPEVKTVTVGYFQNMAPLVVPSLSNTFTDALQRKFIKNTRLGMVNADGDIELQGEIVGYDVAPAAITGNDVASQNRLTVRVKVKFTNKVDSSQDFDKEFSAYEDFPGSQSVDQAQGALIEKIVETMVENIFNASVANW